MWGPWCWCMCACWLTCAKMCGEQQLSSDSSGTANMLGTIAGAHGVSDGQLLHWSGNDSIVGCCNSTLAFHDAGL